MARQIRNGYAVKIGYGKKNEKLQDIEVQKFWNKGDAEAYLAKVIEVVEQGALNEHLIRIEL